MKINNVLSLFDGKSSCYTALELAGIEFDSYFSSEIDKYAIKVSDAIHPEQTRLGDITKWQEWDIDWSSIDLVTGGFPCQAWSMAGKQLGDKDERGMLLWTMLDVMKKVLSANPNAKFLIENVKMKKEFEQYITHHTEQALGVAHKTLINSALVSAQNRNRYYWTNFEVRQPEDKGIVLSDIVDESCSGVNSDGWHVWWHKNKTFQINKSYSAICNNGSTDKAICMTARQYASWSGNFVISQCVGGVNNGIKYRKLTPRECFLLQTMPESLIDKALSCGVSDAQLYKIAGNGWTDEVISHIFRCMKK